VLLFIIAASVFQGVPGYHPSWLNYDVRVFGHDEVSLAITGASFPSTFLILVSSFLAGISSNPLIGFAGLMAVLVVRFWTKLLGKRTE
jgi:hypothetical protein